MNILRFFVLAVCCLGCLTPRVWAGDLVYSPEPVDNPLSGLVPYVSADGRTQFPQSMEFRYFALNQVMNGWGTYDWEPIERTLKQTGKRGNQLIFRVYLEYPGERIAVPDFLVGEGVKITKWKSPDGQCHTPDYDSPVLRRAMREFIAALGKKYDGDPRVGFITAGMLGAWGEWHNYPREDLYPSKDAQKDVMTAFATAFKKTHVLLRYPAGADHYHYTANHEAPFGYHDDSFAWATLDTGKKQDDWFFVPALKQAGEGAVTRWQTHAIGGEIRPELWPRLFTDKPHKKQQDFAACVRQTHVTWLMDTGLSNSRKPPSKERVAAAKNDVRLMGYELFVSKATLLDGTLKLTVTNQGVAPFYYDWPVEVRYSAPKIRTRPLFPDWKLSEVMPGKPVVWEVELGASEEVRVRVRVANPMAGGKPLRFANAEMQGEWLALEF